MKIVEKIALGLTRYLDEFGKIWKRYSWKFAEREFWKNLEHLSVNFEKLKFRKMLIF